jgi:hypothetical protein
MFGDTLALLHQNPQTGEWVDSKIHLHPFMEFRAAQQSLVQYPERTIERNSIDIKETQ